MMDPEIFPPDASLNEAAFSYACTKCGACCTDKKIQINPYEVARLAHNRGMSIPAFRAAYTQDGVMLDQKADGACVFFGETGCSVHPDRPLVCRLFPLGRQVSADGSARFALGRWTPPPNGVFGERGSVVDFVSSQGCEPFIAAADGYFQWYCRATEAQFADDSPSGHDDLLDFNAVIAQQCATTGTTEPESWAARLSLHLLILEQYLNEEDKGHDQIT